MLHPKKAPLVLLLVLQIFLDLVLIPAPDRGPDGSYAVRRLNQRVGNWLIKKLRNLDIKNQVVE